MYFALRVVRTMSMSDYNSGLLANLQGQLLELADDRGTGMHLQIRCVNVIHEDHQPELAFAAPGRDRKTKGFGLVWLHFLSYGGHFGNLLVRESLLHAFGNLSQCR